MGFFFACLSFAVLLLLALCFPAIDGDVFFYLSLGRQLFETGMLPDADPFLYTVKDWNIHHQWLAFVVFYSFYWMGGWTGLLVMKAILWLSAFSVLTCAALRWRVARSLSLALALLTLAACSHRFIDRASLFSDLILLSLSFVLLDAKLVHKRFFYFLPLLFAVWVNLHAGFVIGLAVLSLYALAQGRQGGKVLWLSVMASYLACLANPKFAQGALFPLRTAFRPEWADYRNINFEWMPTFRAPFIHTWEVQILAVLLIAAVLLVGAYVVRQKSNALFALLLLTLYVYLAQDATRFMTTGALGFALLSLYALGHLQPALPPVWDKRLALGFAGLFLALSGWIVAEGYPSASGQRQLGIGIDKQSFPTGAARFIEDNKLNGRIFNQYEWGSYLIWTLDHQDFLFIHTHVDDPNVLTRDYYGMSRSREIFDQTIARYDIRYFLLDRVILKMKPAPDVLVHLKDWQILYQDELSVLWARTK